MSHLSPRLRRWDIIVWGLIAAYFLLFSTLTLQRHGAFQSAAFDLGNVDQAVWNTRQGRPFAMTNIEGLDNRLGTHVEPILLYVAPLYFLWSDVRVLLLLQSATIALGAWPVYRLANLQMCKDATAVAFEPAYSPILAVAFVAAYLLFPALQSANYCDFHALALAPTFFLFAFYCLETERWGGLALFATLAAFCKEDVALLVVMLGLYATLVRRHWRVGMLMIALAGTWFVLATAYILPRFDASGVSPLAGRYHYLGDSLVGIVAGLVSRPGAALEHLSTGTPLAYVRDLLTPVAFLSLLAPQVLLIALPSLAVNLLSTESFMHQLEGGYYYGALLATVVVLSGVYGAARLLRWFSRVRPLSIVLAGLVLMASLLYHRGHGFTPLAADFGRYWNKVDAHDRIGWEMARSIPPDASLAALPHLNPHASHRREIYAIDVMQDGLPAFLHKTDYVWLDVTNGWPLQPAEVKVMVNNLIARGYGIEQATDGWLLLHLGAGSQALPDDFFEFARASDARPEQHLHLQFLVDGEPALECLGFDRQTQFHGLELTFYWRALKSLPQDLDIVLLYTDAATGSEAIPLSLISPAWYPPDRWQVGEIVRSQTVPWPVADDFELGLSVSQGQSSNDLEKPLPIHIVTSGGPVRLADGNRWVWLLDPASARDTAGSW